MMDEERRDICSRYDLAEDKLKSFTRSAVRTKIMLSLKDGDLNAGELEKAIGIRATTILHSIKEMAETDLVTRTSKGYGLTNVGRMQAMILDETVHSIIALDQHHDFWMNHDISGIPDHLLLKIGMIGQSMILKGDLEDILKTQEYWFGEVIKSKRIVGVSPFIVSDHPRAIAMAVERGAEVDLVLTKSLIGIVMRDYKEALNDLLDSGKFRLYSIDRKVTVGFTVTDSYLSLGLFRTDGSYDVGNDLNCFGEKAMEWGMELFEFYRGMSESIDRI